MKVKSRIALVLTICLLVQGCIAVEFDPPVALFVERVIGPLPEKEWNATGIWYRIENNPPTYLPFGLSKKRPRTEKEGVWIFDERESGEKRLFVPYEGASGYSFAVLEADARKACNWPPFEKIKIGGFHLQN